MINFSAFKQENVITALAQLVLFLFVIGLLLKKFIPDNIVLIFMFGGAISTTVFIFRKIFFERR